MEVSLLQVPYHLGHERIGMGLGPVRYLEAGADRLLRDRGHRVHLETIQAKGPSKHEIGATMDVNARLAERVREAASQKRFPFVLAGDCNSALGTLAGLGKQDIGIIWFDAHGEFNTPATSPSGYFDGMPLVMIAGRCWQELMAKKLPQFRLVPGTHILLAGAREFDPMEKEDLKEARISVVEASSLRQKGLEPALDSLRTRTKEIYLHLDLDALDPSEAPANEFPAPGGLTLQDMRHSITWIARRFRVRAAALTAYNPEVDRMGKALHAGLQLMTTVVDAVAHKGEA